MYREHAGISSRYLNRVSRSHFRMAFLGDSVTQGCFELNVRKGIIGAEKDYENVYHAKLKKMAETVFPECQISVINAGVGGDNSEAALNRLNTDVISAKPDLTVVCLGLNDSCGGIPQIGRYAANMERIFSDLRKAGIETIFMTPNMMCTSVDESFLSVPVLNAAARTCCEIQLGGVLEQYIEAAKALCPAYGVKICDCYSDYKRLHEQGADINTLLSNKINHPTREMHSLFAARLFETIFLR